MTILLSIYRTETILLILLSKEAGREVVTVEASEVTKILEAPKTPDYFPGNIAAIFSFFPMNKSFRRTDTAFLRVKAPAGDKFSFKTMTHSQFTNCPFLSSGTFWKKWWFLRCILMSVHGIFMTNNQ